MFEPAGSLSSLSVFLLFHRKKVASCWPVLGSDCSPACLGSALLVDVSWQRAGQCSLRYPPLFPGPGEDAAAGRDCCSPWTVTRAAMLFFPASENTRCFKAVFIVVAVWGWAPNPLHVKLASFLLSFCVICLLQALRPAWSGSAWWCHAVIQGSLLNEVGKVKSSSCVYAVHATVKTPALSGVKFIFWLEVRVLGVEERRVRGCSMLCRAECDYGEKAFPSVTVKLPPLWLSYVAAN